MNRSALHIVVLHERVGVDAMTHTSGSADAARTHLHYVRKELQ